MAQIAFSKELQQSGFNLSYDPKEMPSGLWHHHGCKMRSRITGTEHTHVLGSFCPPLVESWQKQRG